MCYVTVVDAVPAGHLRPQPRGGGDGPRRPPAQDLLCRHPADHRPGLDRRRLLALPSGSTTWSSQLHHRPRSAPWMRIYSWVRLGRRRDRRRLLGADQFRHDQGGLASILQKRNLAGAAGRSGLTARAGEGLGDPAGARPWPGGRSPAPGPPPRHPIRSGTSGGLSRISRRRGRSWRRSSSEIRPLTPASLGAQVDPAPSSRLGHGPCLALAAAPLAGLDSSTPRAVSAAPCPGRRSVRPCRAIVEERELLQLVGGVGDGGVVDHARDMRRRAAGIDVTKHHMGAHPGLPASPRLPGCLVRERMAARGRSYLRSMRGTASTCRSSPRTMTTSDSGRRRGAFGGRRSALPALLDLARTYAAERKPVLGICLGGRSSPAPGGRRWIGRRPGIRRSPAPHRLPPATGDGLLDGTEAALPAMHWHDDRFDLPNGACRS